jgi:hypothetical protein
VVLQGVMVRREGGWGCWVEGAERGVEGVGWAGEGWVMVVGRGWVGGGWGVGWGRGWEGVEGVGWGVLVAMGWEGALVVEVMGVGGEGVTARPLVTHTWL